MSTTIRIATMRLMRKLGITHFRARSGVNQYFICHLGDSRGENHFYNPNVCRAEIILMYAWCSQIERPIVFDIGGNIGFVATQLAQLLYKQRPKIFSFEPVPHTFTRLYKSVHILKLDSIVYPICSALSDVSGVIRMSYSKWDSMCARVLPEESQVHLDRVCWSISSTIDDVANRLDEVPDLIKIDVEGHEVQVFRGGSGVLSEPTRPALCFELNPELLLSGGGSVERLAEQLVGYDFYFVDDDEGSSKMRFGESIASLTSIDWTCNIFGIPNTEYSRNQWLKAYMIAKDMLNTIHTSPLQL